MKTSFMGSIFIAVFMLLPVLLYADVPNEIVYQGKLKEYGQLVTATRNIQFKIFDAPTGGAQIGLPYGGNMSVTNGLFSYVLNLSGVDWYQGNYWIETVVDSKILSPREKLTASAYALHSRTSEGIQKKSGTTIDFNIGTETKASIATDGTMSCLVSGTSYYMVPRGAIIMWSGTIASIPSGWALCDGTNGTPNLLDRFILSIENSTEVPGATGGSNAITLSVANLPSHNHTGTTGWQSVDHTHSGTTGSAGAHTHEITGFNGQYIVAPGASGSWHGGPKIDGGGDSYPGWLAVSNGAHTHSFSTGGVSVNHNHSFTTDLTGSGSAIDSRPAFFKLAFIMRL